MDHNDNNNILLATNTDNEAAGIASSIVETFGEAMVEPSPDVDERAAEPSARFQDLEIGDEANEAQVMARPVMARPVLEIEGLDVYCDEPEDTETATDKPALRALRAAGLDFKVSLVPVNVSPLDVPRGASWNQPPNAEDFRFCLREDTGHIFGITGPDYGFVNPEELAGVVDAALPAGADKVKVHSSAFGDHLWFSVDLPEGQFTVTPEIQAEADARGWIHIDPRGANGHTPVMGRLLFKHAFGGKGSYDVWMVLEALICGNGLRVPLKSGEQQIKIRHTRNFENRVADLRHAFEVAQGAIPVFSALFNEMGRTRITMAQFDEYAEELFPGNTAQAQNKRKRLAEINTTAVGCAPGTAWGALQAATYYATHETSVRVSGRSLSKYTLDDPQDLSGAQINALQGQARLERLVYGDAGAFTENALQYVTNNWISLS